MDRNGECAIENPILFVLAKSRPALNLIRRRGLKGLFFIFGDLWLYNFHQQQYDGSTQTVIEIIALIEEKQYELIGLEKVKEQMEEGLEESIAQLNEYNCEANPTFIQKQRKNNLFLLNTLDYFVFHIPFTLLSVFLLNRLFHCLFQFEISSLLRHYSFWWIILELLVVGNIELFTFLALRNCQTSFSSDLTTRLMQVLMILLFFIIVVSTFSSYPWYYAQYRKLAKYFLSNMFRFPSSYNLMVILYGFRPFLKGVVHALLY